MNIDIRKLGAGSDIESEYRNKDAWFASIMLSDGHTINIKEVDGKLQLNTPSGYLIIKPEASNSINVGVYRE